MSSKKKKGTKKKSSGFGKLIALFIIAIGIYGGNLYYQNFIKSNVDTKGKKVMLFIPKGAGSDLVVHKLKELNVIKDINSFKWLLSKKNYQGRNIVAGKYEIIDGSSNNTLINHLRAGNGRLDSKVQFNQVRDLKELSSSITKDILLDSSEVYNWLTNEDSIAKFGFNKNTIISMFIPNTYNVDVDITCPNLMKKMGREYKKFWTPGRKQKALNCNLSQSEVTTLASIVYWETKMKEDMPKVAGVYMNRLEKGIPLQADPTLIFALGDYSKQRVLNKDKEVDSPYNTYKYRGLPPGPIILPPAQYLDAVLNYEKHDYIFFVAKEDFSGYSYFSKTLSQHNIYAKKWQKALDERGIYN